MTLAPAVPTLPARVDAALARFLTARAVFGRDDDLRDLLATTRRFVLHGGKRLRPALCYWAWHGTGGASGSARGAGMDVPGPGGFDAAAVLAGLAEPGRLGAESGTGASGEDEQAVVAGAALELFHCFALIHDDIIDASSFRRGRPSLHEEFAQRHAGRGWGGDAAAFGRGAAMLCGDLCAMWAEELLAACGAPADRLRAAQSLFALMRAEAMAGEYLDLLGTATGHRPPAEPGPTTAGPRSAAQVAGQSGESAPRIPPIARQLEAGCGAWEGGPDGRRILRVVRLKTARYSIVRPLQIGAVLAGAGEPDLVACAAFGEPLGRAFQLRDDVLGVFGEPAETGKSVLDDLRQAKPTMLLAEAWARAVGADREVLRTHVGEPELDEAGAARVREVMTGCGALAAVERRIGSAHRRARYALAAWELTEQARRELSGLADAAVHRSR
ncbi:polyprenyl synthetase family protein [Catellatospora tritici]|uniref:polyprenyl synthetase family protein n=1 Tax=Catellatospora tritici TaxID=2851566 RepID=UPI001C2DA12D|nr:polyprenyl synthetase family protein [Catellatospora tritici]MBV1851599.1 polyprenyl synthetase family protein [Catellatospora tritici]